jgi:hypothetical protein
MSARWAVRAGTRGDRPDPQDRFSLRSYKGTHLRIRFG